MYSRYIPPKSTPSQGKAPAASPAPPEPIQPKAALPIPISYSRYIPPQKPSAPTKQHLHFDDAEGEVDPIVADRPPTKKARLSEHLDEVDTPSDLLQDGQQPEVKPVEPEARIEKTEKKSKKDKKAKSTISGVPVDEDMAAAVGTGEVKRDKKKKKKPIKTPEEETQADDDDEIRRRHKSVFEKKAKALTTPESGETLDVQVGEDGDLMMVDVAPEQAHGLEPLPQPAPVVLDPKPTYETLPSWLAEPVRVSPKSIAPFTDFRGLAPELGLTPEIAAALATKGYKQAFAVQTVVIPLLLPQHCKSMQGDVLVAAATGSGKTLAYALPVARDISLGNRHVTKLRALVVLPTRELVRQARDVFEQMAGIFAHNGERRRAKVGIAMGSQTLQKEQTALVEREERLDPEGYESRLKRLSLDELDGYNTEDEERAEISRREDEISTLPDHTIDYKSKVDILICTPGRLVEHIKKTPGFCLDYVRWLVVDEADKLLGQDFQQWLGVVMPKLRSSKPNARSHMQTNLSGVRKVILSATMTRDLDLLADLKLRRPKLVVLEGTEDDGETGERPAEHTLPQLLQETAIKADANLKPMYLLDLLQSSHVLGLATNTLAMDLSDDTSSSGSDSELEEISKPQPTAKSSILIFTKSNETALRLSRLLSIMSPSIGSILGTLTSTGAYAERKKTLRSFSAGKLRVLVASDLIARGIDLPSLDHVINYDMPVSIESYVHRVGRTARAGKSGQAWTLFTDSEAWWFWKKGPASERIGRVGQVERLRVTEEKEAAFEVKRGRYEEALETLGKEAAELKRQQHVR
ncbi:P-loop containing nucleoside triphosphate hydrolase protein [Pseudomassariella vexata]|uniref:ATP-dependent RNA helicase n=1 Tax=Pseudomassariella vexata TaxID=1141098 RepID=A0A1Y2DCR2_9PEZI|nr:P-loop containing nucleoside triphosphate hydrolase protein [Pseudomassariella vexata]ORY56967.1 P-loop containing nucleoside triphosphate hydrolase protein [Pseudomassariella vexata]